jgi:hypothetical protein
VRFSSGEGGFDEAVECPRMGAQGFAVDGKGVGGAGLTLPGRDEKGTEPANHDARADPNGELSVSYGRVHRLGPVK